MKTTKTQTAEYIRDLSTELAIYARKSGLHSAAYMLEVAAAEAGDAAAGDLDAANKSHDVTEQPTSRRAAAKTRQSRRFAYG